MNCLTRKEDLITLFDQREAEEGKMHIQNHSLIYILKGNVTFSYGHYSTGKVEQGTLVFLPIDNHVNYKIEKETQLITFQLTDNLQICECLSSDEFKKGIQRTELQKHIDDSSATLMAKSMITTYMDGLLFNIKAGITENAYFEIKIEELLLLLKAFYSREELAAFFGTTLYEDIAFPIYILKNHHAYDSVAEIAEAMHYTVSGFSKRFIRVFGTPPSKWMKEQKAKRIYREVCFGKQNFKELADNYNFSSTSTFNDFFKQTFGETPGVVRKKHQAGGFEEVEGR